MISWALAPDGWLGVPAVRAPDDCGIVTYAALTSTTYAEAVREGYAGGYRAEEGGWGFVEMWTAVRRRRPVGRMFEAHPGPLSRFLGARPDWTGAVAVSLPDGRHHVMPVVTGWLFNHPGFDYQVRAAFVVKWRGWAFPPLRRWAAENAV